MHFRIIWPSNLITSPYAATSREFDPSVIEAVSSELGHQLCGYILYRDEVRGQGTDRACEDPSQ
jgi:hypothetical protein